MRSRPAFTAIESVGRLSYLLFANHALGFIVKQLNSTLAVW